jgi:hypothetical protein
MNPIPEPEELLESECNAQGLYGLPPEAFARKTVASQPPDEADEPDAGTGVSGGPRAD